MESQPETGTSERKESNKGIKKALTPWIIYSKENRENIRSENPNFTFKQIAQKLSEKYKSLSADELDLLRLKALDNKTRYLEDVAHNEEECTEINKSPDNSDILIPLVRIIITTSSRH